jgi:hypothetical protein
MAVVMRLEPSRRLRGVHAARLRHHRARQVPSAGADLGQPRVVDDDGRRAVNEP